jgi:hypothetical protein
MPVKCHYCSHTFRSAAGRAGHEHYKHQRARKKPVTNPTAESKTSFEKSGSSAMPQNRRQRRTARATAPRPTAPPAPTPATAASSATVSAEVRFCPNCRCPIGSLSHALAAPSVALRFCPACGCAIEAVRRALAGAASETRH